MIIHRPRWVLFAATAILSLSAAAWGQAGNGTDTGAAKNSQSDASAPSPATFPVLYYTKDQVEASFEQTGGGDTLYGGDNGARNYKIATSVRKKPGVAEVHMNLTDVCYILKGSATMVYGGKMVDLIDSKFRDGRPYPKDELRGHNIVGGETRHLSAGDVVIIPNGVPHWFTQIDAPFWYYVVKVRNQ